MKTDRCIPSGDERQPWKGKVLAQHQSSAIGRVTVRLWISEAAAHLNGFCRFCLCHEKLAVPTPVY